MVYFCHVSWFTPPKTTESQDIKLDLISKFGNFSFGKRVHFLNAKCWFPGLLICKNHESRENPKGVGICLIQCMKMKV